MKKLLLTLIILLSSTILFAQSRIIYSQDFESAVAGTNLLGNMQVQNYNAGGGAAWTYDIATGAQALSGSKSAHLNIQNPGNQWWGLQFKVEDAALTTVVKGMSYNITFKIKSSTSNNKFQFYVQGQSGFEQDITIPTANVTQVVSIDTTPMENSGTANFLWAFGYNPNVGNIWIDDIVITEKYTPINFSENFNTVVPGVSNIGDFDLANYGNGAWTFGVEQVGADPLNKCARLNITQNSDAWWTLQFKNSKLIAVQGKQYVINFKAKSNISNSLLVRMEGVVSFEQRVNLTSSYQNFSIESTAMDNTGPVGFMWAFGNPTSLGTIWIDDITIQQKRLITGGTTANSFTTTYGTVSAAQTFPISGTGLIADITATAPTGFEVSSNGSTYGATATFTQTSGNVSGTLSVRLAANAAVSGSYNSQNIVLSSTGTSSVNIITAASGNTVTAKALSVGSASIASKAYNGSATSGTVTPGSLSGFVGSETVTINTAVGTYADANVGTGKTATIVYTLADGTNNGKAVNYSLANGSANGNITSKQLNVTAGAQSVAYGTAASTVTAAGSYTLSGLVNGELAANVISGTATYSTNYTNTTTAGSSGVTITYSSGLTSANGNYWFQAVAGSITILKVNSSISVTGTTSFNYNGSAQGPASSNVTGSTGAVTYSYVGTGGTIYSASATAPTAVGSYTVTASVAADANYNGASSSATGFTISAVAPGAPIAATATAGNAQASVAFTAPGDNGGSAIIDYTVTSSPGGLTATGASSPIVVTGLTNGTGYTFTVTARNSAGSSSASDASNSVTPVSPSVTVSSDANLSSYTTTSATDVTVSAGELTVDADATVKTMTVAPGAKLTLASGKTLTVAGALTLQSDATGTATFVDNGGTVSAGSTNVQQYLTTGRNWYISSPVSGATAAIFNPAGLSNLLYSYDETHGSTAPWPAITNNATGLTVMKGYVANMASSGVVTFSGTLNTGAQEIALTQTSGQVKNGFNLVGNPYPSYLDWSSITKTNMLTTMWYRTKTSGDVYTFDTYNASGNISTSNGAKAVTNMIPPMQAFWVHVQTGFASSTLAVTNAQRAHADNSSNTFKAKAVTSQSVLRLVVSNGINSDQALVNFNSNASNGLDSYDSPKLSNESASIPEIYTLAGTEQVVINGVNDATELALGFTTGEAGNFSIKASQFANFASGTQIVLRDNLLNYEQDLTLADYNFYSDVTANNETRFTVLFKAPSVATGINPNTTGNVWISINGNNQIVVNGANAGTSVAVYNAVGQKIMSDMTQLKKSLATGVYMVTVTNAGKIVTQKVIIK